MSVKHTLELEDVTNRATILVAIEDSLRLNRIAIRTGAYLITIEHVESHPRSTPGHCAYTGYGRRDARESAGAA